jgi:hypothetical protein
MFGKMLQSFGGIMSAKKSGTIISIVVIAVLYFGIRNFVVFNTCNGSQAYIKFDDRVYAQIENGGRSPQFGQEIGVISEAASDDCRTDRLANGGAMGVEPETIIYNLENYDTDFRLAARINRQSVVFEVAEIPDAQTGRDWWDIEGKVLSVNIFDFETLMAGGDPVRINDQDGIDWFVNSLLSAETVEANLDDAEVEQIFTILLTLKDGSRVEIGYLPEQNVLEHHLQPSAEFQVTFLSWFNN